jgi:ubiquinone/menaquinone biosynthesis C-methylase UbiE
MPPVLTQSLLSDDSESVRCIDTAFVSRALKAWPGKFGKAILRAMEAELVSEYQLGERSLDLGCGDGAFIGVVLGTSMSVGVDTNASRLAQAVTRACYASTVCAAAHNLPFPSNHFRTILANSVLEHIENLDSTLQELCRVLEPGGRMLITCPAPKKRERLLHARPDAFAAVGMPRSRAQEYLLHFDAYWQHRHYLTTAEWISRLSRSGLAVVRAKEFESAECTELIDALDNLQISPAGLWDADASFAVIEQWLVRTVQPIYSSPPIDGGSAIFIEAIKESSLCP